MENVYKEYQEGFELLEREMNTVYGRANQLYNIIAQQENWWEQEGASNLAYEDENGELQYYEPYEYWLIDEFNYNILLDGGYPCLYHEESDTYWMLRTTTGQSILIDRDLLEIYDKYAR